MAAVPAPSRVCEAGEAGRDRGPPRRATEGDRGLEKERRSARNESACWRRSESVAYDVDRARAINCSWSSDGGRGSPPRGETDAEAEVEADAEAEASWGWAGELQTLRAPACPVAACCAPTSAPRCCCGRRWNAFLAHSRGLPRGGGGEVGETGTDECDRSAPGGVGASARIGSGPYREASDMAGPMAELLERMRPDLLARDASPMSGGGGGGSAADPFRGLARRELASWGAP